MSSCGPISSSSVKPFYIRIAILMNTPLENLSTVTDDTHDWIVKKFQTIITTHLPRNDAEESLL